MKIELRTPNEDWGCALYKGAHYTPENTVGIADCVLYCRRSVGSIVANTSMYYMTFHVVEGRCMAVTLVDLILTVLSY